MQMQARTGFSRIHRLIGFRQWRAREHNHIFRGNCLTHRRHRDRLGRTRRRGHGVHRLHRCGGRGRNRVDWRRLHNGRGRRRSDYWPRLHRQGGHGRRRPIQRLPRTRRRGGRDVLPWLDWARLHRQRCHGYRWCRGYVRGRCRRPNRTRLHRQGGHTTGRASGSGNWTRMGHQGRPGHWHHRGCRGRRRLHLHRCVRLLHIGRRRPDDPGLLCHC